MSWWKYSTGKILPGELSTGGNSWGVGANYLQRDCPGGIVWKAILQCGERILCCKAYVVTQIEDKAEPTSQRP